MLTFRLLKHCIEYIFNLTLSLFLLNYYRIGIIRLFLFILHPCFNIMQRRVFQNKCLNIDSFNIQFDYQISLDALFRFDENFCVKELRKRLAAVTCCRFHYMNNVRCLGGLLFKSFGFPMQTIFHI